MTILTLLFFHHLSILAKTDKKLNLQTTLIQLKTCYQEFRHQHQNCFTMPIYMTIFSLNPQQPVVVINARKQFQMIIKHIWGRGKGETFSPQPQARVTSYVIQSYSNC